MPCFSSVISSKSKYLGFANGWKLLNRKRDDLDYEWEAWKLFVWNNLLWFIFHLTVTEIFRWIRPKVILYASHGFQNLHKNSDHQLRPYSSQHIIPSHPFQSTCSYHHFGQKFHFRFVDAFQTKTCDLDMCFVLAISYHTLQILGATWSDGTIFEFEWISMLRIRHHLIVEYFEINQLFHRLHRQCGQTDNAFIRSGKYLRICVVLSEFITWTVYGI